MWFLTFAGCLGEAVTCGDACPPGTALAARSTARVDAVRVIASECAATCNPIEPCLPPNVPAAWQEDGALYFECQALGGYGTLPDVDEVDTDYGQTWAAVPEPLSFEPLPVSIDPLSLLHVDRDRDGTAELLARDSATGEGLWLLGAAGGGLEVSPAGVLGAVSADLDGDGVVEALRFTAAGGDMYLERCVAGADFSFDASDCVGDMLASDTAGGGVIGGLGADMDGDGDEDLLVVSGDGDVLVAVGGGGPGDSGLGPLRRIGSTGRTDANPWNPAQAGDIDGDGAAEVLLASGDGLAWLVAGGPGGWQAVSSLGADPAAAAVSDLDGDGIDDIVALRAGEGCGGGCVAVYEDGALVDAAEAAYGILGLTRCRGVDWDDDGAGGMICAEDATALVWRAGELWDLPRSVADYNGYFSALLTLSDGPALLWFLASGDGTTDVYGVRP